MEVATRDILIRIKKMDLVISNGLMAVLLEDIGKMTKYVVKSFIYLKMDTNTKDNLWMTKCMAKVLINGQMDAYW